MTAFSKSSDNPYITFPNVSGFPATGSFGKQYLAENTNLLYRWTGSNYIEISPSMGGITEHSGLNLDDGTNPHNTTKGDVGLGNVDNTSDVDKPVSTAQGTAIGLKEDSFAKNTAFNKNFGTTAGTVLEGDKNTDITNNASDITNLENISLAPPNGVVNAYDWDLGVNAGVYRADGSSTNKPDGFSQESMLIYKPIGSTYIVQECINGSGSGHATRRSNDSGVSWSDWKITLNNLTAGNNIDIDKTDPKNFIINSTVVTRTNWVLVKTKSDLPTPSGGIITLAANTAYEINGTIVLGTDRILGDVSNIIYGVDKSDDILVYTGTGNMITSINQDISINKVTLVASSVGAKPFSIVGDGTNRIEIAENIIANSDSLGEITGGFATIVYRNNLHTGNAGGLTISGSNNDLIITDNLFEDFTGTPTFITISNSGSTYHTIIISRNMFEAGAGQTCLSIDLGLVLEAGGIIAENAFEGVGAKLIGIDASTEGWKIAPSSNLNLTGKLLIEPKQIVDAQYFTNSSTMYVVPNLSVNLRPPSLYQLGSTTFKSEYCSWHVTHAQAGETLATCIWDNTNNHELGFGADGKFTIGDITWQGGDIVRYTFDGAIAPEVLGLDYINIGEKATFEGCTNASNDGEYIITSVNNVGGSYWIEVVNPNRMDATDDEVGSPGLSYGGSVVYRTVAAAATVELVVLPNVKLFNDVDYRAAIRRVTFTGGNPNVSITEEFFTTGWISIINY